MDKKPHYEKPVLRKVRLEVKTSVLATCRNSSNMSPATSPGPLPCYLNGCVDAPSGTFGRSPSDR